MFEAMVITVGLLCAAPKIKNDTPELFGTNSHDVSSLQRAMAGCKKMYGTCLKTFTKRPNNHYNAICGRRKNVKKKIESPG